MTQHTDPPPWVADGSWRARATEALSSISEAVCFLDAEYRYTWVNDAAERLLERPAAELVGQVLWTQFPDRPGAPWQQSVRRARSTRSTQHLEFFHEPLDRWFEVRAYPVLDDLVLFFRDVHERRTLDEERAAESSLIRGVLNALPARTAILSDDGTILTTNTAWAQAATTAGRPGASRAGDDYLAACRALAATGDPDAQRAVEGLEAVLERRAPSFSLDYSPPTAGTWWHLQAFPVDGGPGAVVTHTDITDRVRAEQRAAWQARHDHLTELPNRAALHETITGALTEDGGPVTVLYLDVDGFKQVNDSLGHSTGDLLLQELAARLSQRTRTSDVVGRLGGDEFVVVARDCDAPAGEVLAQRFRAVFDEPFELAGTRLSLTASIGTATSDPAHTGPEDLLRDADAAMYAAKSDGRDQHLHFTPTLRTALEDRRQVVTHLQGAAALDQLTVRWQPVVHLPSGTVTGCEALLRWEHPHRGWLEPAEFIPVAEETGMIVPITRWLLRTAIAQAEAWQADGHDLAVAVNVSAVHLSSGTLVDDVRQALAGRDLDPGDLVLELTETALARDPEHAVAQFCELRTHGVRIALDDFGAGYSSLAAVASLPADVLKVDRALVAGPLPAAATAPEALLGAVAALGAALDMAVLAEGVETAAQLELARRVGCTYAQGHHLSPPVTGDRLGALLTEGRRKTGQQRLP
ncbi:MULTISPECIES: putative bifunctional diguanylate cyclase/phosphodiesterase [unclassified Modestobacter]|uniref:putative bifunctional diguanylate cyclase/phosphodiesterase n=1 Tax=unclassified Modestobacter TaxID=2643866 RepID=UPI0022AB2103|nr:MULTISPECIES: EAL domain-containing protein [unclassified Modestobacter]MCZ2824269.1 EAL domain-containing protein [Modestobacter sp. VKM Ac-2981]MCZ2854203.1 EAL domain-containing protein [Modestobacter sp. VKM Ac-2982]